MVRKVLELGEARMRVKIITSTLQRSDKDKQKALRNLEDKTERRVISRVKFNKIDFRLLSILEKSKNKGELESVCSKNDTTNNQNQKLG